MASFPLYFLAPLLLFFTLSPLSSHCANNIESSLAVPSSVTPRAAAIQYWYAKVHNNKPPPHVLLSKLSSHESPLELLITNSDNMKSFDDVKKLENLFEELRHKITSPLSSNRNNNDPSKESENRYAELRQKKPPIVWNWNRSKASENLDEEFSQKIPPLLN